MSMIVVYLVGAWLLLMHIAMRRHIRQLEKRLKQVTDPTEYLTYLRQQPVQSDKVASIKALRKQYPELSLLEANQLWQQK